MLSSSWTHGLVFGNGDTYGPGGCFSALGLSPKFTGHLTKTLTQMGAKGLYSVEWPVLDALKYFK